MLDRVQVTRPERRIVNRAAQVSQNRIVGAGSGVAAGQGVQPADETTTRGEGDDGTIYTKHMFMLGIDTLGDISGELSVQGEVIDYGD